MRGPQGHDSPKAKAERNGREPRLYAECSDCDGEGYLSDYDDTCKPCVGLGFVEASPEQIRGAAARLPAGGAEDPMSIVGVTGRVLLWAATARGFHWRATAYDHERTFLAEAHGSTPEAAFAALRATLSTPVESVHAEKMGPTPAPQKG